MTKCSSSFFFKKLGISSDDLLFSCLYCPWPNKDEEKRKHTRDVKGKPSLNTFSFRSSTSRNFLTSSRVGIDTGLEVRKGGH